MKRLPAAGLVLLLLPLPPARAADHPRVDFEYSDIWARVCGELSGQEIGAEQEAAARALTAELAVLWADNEKALLGTAIEIVGAPFPARELHAVVSVCRTPSMSKPLVLNVRPWLEGGAAPPLDRAVLVATVFHESLHWYVHARVPRASPLLAKYAGEDLLVRNHLHLLALLKRVYEKLGRSRELALVVDADRRLPRPAYKRAWEIVNAEGAGPFVSELQR
jgi:hypothetical protein